MPSSINQQFVEAARNNQFDDLKTLLSQGADIHANYDVALRLSAQNGHLEIVKFLISQGANVSAKGEQALRWAVEDGYLEIVKFLVAQGANIHANDDEALRGSAANGHLEIVKFLLTQGANIHANDDEALRGSALYGHLEIVKFLLVPSASTCFCSIEANAATSGTAADSVAGTQGANIHAQDDEVFKTAIKNGNKPMLMLLNSFLNKEKLRAAADSNFVSGPNVSMASSATMPKKQHTELKKIKRSKI